MLQNLHVKNLALIEEEEVDFKPGLNILTGETGAGKSIILGSVQLALGGRYSADMLRKGAAFGLVELSFSVEKEHQLCQLADLDIFPEEGVVVLSRKLMEGRSVCRINGETVQMAALKDAAAVLIDIHGQHEHQSLLYKKHHLNILDAFAKDLVEPEKHKIQELFIEYKKIKEVLKKASADVATRNKEIDFLEFEIQEIRQANLTDGEDQQLEEQYRFMLNSKKIVDNIQEVYGYTSEEDGRNASEFLSRAIKCMQDISNYDEKAGILLEQLVEIDSLLNDFNHEVADYSKTLEFSPEVFYEIETRLNELNRLKKKYGNSVNEILEYCQSKEERLLQLKDYDKYILNLEEKYTKAKQVLESSAAVLSKIRKKQALALKKAIKEGLQELNFLDVQFEIAFTQLTQTTANGRDEVEFLISMNPGEPVKPLGDVASGGELSRIMLAIKTVMADKDDIESLIFDEIDVGISGRTAQKVSEKMAVIGKNHQVICITHLAQIAAMADAHFAIEKEVVEGITKTSIKLLDEKQSIGELARILGGAKITDTVIQSAVEMKELAKGTK